MALPVTLSTSDLLDLSHQMFSRSVQSLKDIGTLGGNHNEASHQPGPDVGAENMLGDLFDSHRDRHVPGQKHFQILDILPEVIAQFGLIAEVLGQHQLGHGSSFSSALMSQRSDS
jgi:hypothetical protein